MFLANFLLLLASIGLARLALAYHLDVDFTRLEGGLIAFIFSGLGLTVGFIPRSLQQKVGEASAQLLGNRVATALAAILLLAALAVSSVITYAVRWAGPERLAVSVNGSSRELRGEADADGMQTARVLGVAFVPQRFRFESYQRDFTLMPFEEARLDVPLHLTAPRTPRIAQLENSLLTTFYQYFEEQRLNESAAAIAAFQPGSGGEEAAMQRIDAIFRALQLVFSGREPSAILTAHLEAYRARYLGDPWPTLIEAAAMVRKRQYSDALQMLDDAAFAQAETNATPEFVASMHFVRATAELRQATLDAASGEALFAAAAGEFASAEQIAARSADTTFRSIAHPSTIIFQGINAFYKGDYNEASTQFTRATTVSEGSLRARALNSAGFVEFISGNLDRSEAFLIQALTADPGFAYARSNLGFVLMARGNHARATSLFQSNANDPVLQQTSRRDVLLAEISLVHLADLRGAPLEEVNSGYARALASVGQNDFAGIDRPELRFALLARDVANRIYLGGQYYGLEVFALNMQCRALEVLDASSARDAATLDVRREIVEGIALARQRVSPVWLDGARLGWFRSLNACG